jgi:aerobic-type carbon monoxide dehydrogenase small subunit (CoxS/CutS family)
MDYARSILEKAAQREEKWLAGDWDSRSVRGINTMHDHRARLDSLTAALAQVVGDHCGYCNRTYPRLAVRSHHHYEEPTQ